MKTKFNLWVQKYAVFFILGGLLLFLLIVLILSESFYGTGDSVTHYRYSRYSWIYPKWLLWHWGKPVFTLLSSPFAQFGFTGVQVFNILVAIATAWFGYRVLKMLEINNAFLYPIFLVFSPIYTIMTYSGMTEVLFGFFSIFFAYLFLRNKYKLSASFYSFAPLVRTEGIILLPVYALGLFLKKKYKSLPFFLLGIIVYSIIGYFYYHDLFWLITKMPYGTDSPYGTGSLIYYFEKYAEYLGVPLTPLVLVGIIKIFVNIIRRKRNAFEITFLILLPALTFFCAHIFMWWSGVGNSNGSIRYMVAIMPLTSIFAIIGLNVLLSFIKSVFLNSAVRFVVLIPLLIFIINEPFRQYQLPTPYTGNQKYVHEASEWLKESGHLEKKFYYWFPDFEIMLDFNPFNKKIVKQGLNNYEIPHKHIDKGSIIIYDQAFAPTMIPFNKLKSSPHFKVIKTFGVHKGSDNNEPFIYIIERI